MQRPLYRPGSGTLTAIRYWDEILGPTVRCYSDAVDARFQHSVYRLFGQNVHAKCLCPTSCVRDVHTQPLTGPHVRLTNRPNRTNLGYYIWIHPTPPGCVLESPGALVQISADIPQDNIHLFIRSMSLCCQACIQAQTTEHHSKLLQ